MPRNDAAPQAGAEPEKKAAPKIRTEALIKSRAFGGYQQDLLRAALPAAEYAAAEAAALAEKFFGKRGK
jgi:hypothetical protein